MTVEAVPDAVARPGSAHAGQRASVRAWVHLNQTLVGRILARLDRRSCVTSGTLRVCICFERGCMV